MAKIGENDPCHCGSGKKRKKCHGDIAAAPPSVPLDVRAEARRFLNQPGIKPGCYDAPEFLALEQRDPGVAEEYAWHVLTRARTPEEDERTRRIVSRLQAAIEGRCTPEELLGQCVNTSSAISRMLDAEGIWSFVVRGSTKTEFDASLGIEAQYFWSRNKDRDFTGGYAGHAWVVAPPFVVIDFTAAHQRWSDGGGRHVPAGAVLQEFASARFVRPHLDLVHPLPHERPSDHAMIHPKLQDFWARLKPVEIKCGSILRVYQPDGIGLLDAPLEGLKRPSFGGLSPLEFYRQAIAGGGTDA
ncbi:MAG TPA: SEC-C metal-binding domain-containing protein [Archangium sp.]|uniref:SEC-C metal-binding domain-containing protein n=1 Tax=Archangium sp. TaxID=1872627 RepID=UPI002E30ABED|nr:SEC-C metal-binding domain-containing protein [Archangium sp.]HEX5747438.1 SEC-C metal-binding domain-containing protein [Archangium sp.]